MHINTSASGGAGIAARRMQEALLAQGVQAGFLSKTLTLGFKGEQLSDPFFKYNKPSFISRLKNKLGWHRKKQLQFEQLLQAIEPAIKAEIITSPESCFDLLQHPLVQQADIIHLHWVNGILDYPSFFKAIDKPVFWTLHDMNPFLGLYHYREDETRNSGKSAHELNESFKVIKKDAYQQLKALHLVSPSQWLIEQAKASGIFPNDTKYSVLANGLDLEMYSDPKDNDFLKQEEPLKLIYVSDRLENPRKGADLLRDALSQLSIPVRLVTMGAGSMQVNNPLLDVQSLGFIEDESEKVKAISQAAALLLPSREDNLPNTMLEALAAGTPVLGFKIGGLAEHITDGFNGLLAKELSATALASVIEQFHKQKQDFDRTKIKAYAQEHFDANNQAKKLVNRYLEPRNNAQKPQTP